MGESGVMIRKSPQAGIRPRDAHIVTATCQCAAHRAIGVINSCSFRFRSTLKCFLNVIFHMQTNVVVG